MLIPSRDDDLEEKIRFGDGVLLMVPGHGAAIEQSGDNVYMAIGLRNGGSGLAVIHGWRAEPMDRTGSDRPDLTEFRRQSRDLHPDVQGERA